jgi:hypothetical protein
MPQVCLDRLRVGALADQQSRAGVPQRPTLRGGRHEPVRVAGPAGRVHGQVVAEEPRQPDGALGVGLGRAQDQAATDLAGRLDHPHRAPQQIQPLDPQRGQLADRLDAARAAAGTDPARTEPQSGVVELPPRQVQEGA